MRRQLSATVFPLHAHALQQLRDPLSFDDGFFPEADTPPSSLAHEVTTSKRIPRDGFLDGCDQPGTSVKFGFL